MASKNFSGTLDLPLGSKAAGMKWRFTHQKTTGDVIAASPETTMLTETGQYNFDLKFGQILIESKLPSQQNWFSHGSVVIDENTAISTLPELLVATSPVTEDVIIQMQAILQDARDAEASSLESSIEAQDLLNETQGLISSFQSVEEIKKKATLSLDFTKNEHKTYEALGLESKPLAEILTTERATAGAYQSPFGLRVAEPNEPRVTYNEATRSPLGLLSEGAATNLFLSSESPVSQSINTGPGSYTLSFWGNGEVTLSGAASGSLVGGTERSSLTATSSGGGINLSISGDVNFVQFESGLFATSYIKTEASQVTRLEDAHSITPEINPDAGTIFLNVIAPSVPSLSNYFLQLASGTALNTNNGILFWRNAGNLRISVFASGTATAFQLENSQDITATKMAISYKNGQVASSAIGGELISAQVIQHIDWGANLRLSLSVPAGGNRNRIIKSVNYYPVTLSDSDLVELTK